MSGEFPEVGELPVVLGLPDALVMRSGEKVRTVEEWRERRRPELRGLFEHYMYGRMPGRRGSGEVKLLLEDRGALEGAARLREFEVEVGLERRVRLLVVSPRGGARGCFLGLNFSGNHYVLDHPGIALPYDGEAWERAGEAAEWQIAATIERGFAVATFYQIEVVPDDPVAARAALTALSGGAAGDATGTLMGWAWGFSRMLDALEKIGEVDARRVAAVGHSRNGKAALLAAALDERFALVVPSQAGCGGSAPLRVSAEMAKRNAAGRPLAETVDMITQKFPHWFAGNFAAFADEPARLPFDQHCLIAMCAPRPVLLSCAEKDVWSNPAGQWDMLRAADPVYQLVAGDGLGDALWDGERPRVGELLASRLGYFMRKGKHSIDPVDWEAWCEYAGKWLGK